MFIKTVSNPVEFLVSKSYMMDYLRALPEDESVVKRLIERAHAAFSAYTNGNVLAPTDFEVYYDLSEVQDVVRLPVRPIIELSVSYFDPDNVEHDLEESDYFYIPGDCQVEIHPEADIPVRATKSVKITATCGRTLENIEPDILLGLEQFIVHAFEHRGDESVDLPDTVQSLWVPYVIRRFGV